MEKLITIIVVEEGKEKRRFNLSIFPMTTPRQVLESQRLNGHRLFRFSTGIIFAANDDLFQCVECGEVVLAVQPDGDDSLQED